MRKSLKIRQEVSDDKEERRRIASLATNTEKKEKWAKERRDRLAAADVVNLVVKVRSYNLYLLIQLFVFTNTIICIYITQSLYLQSLYFVFTNMICN